MSEELSTPSKFSSVAKHVFLALMTGGASLIWLLMRKLPAMWDRVVLARAKWIEAGRDPRAWKWISQGWVCALLTILVLAPGALMVSALLSLVLGVHAVQPGYRITFGAILIGSVPMLAFFISCALLTTWAFHSLRQLFVLCGSHITSTFRSQRK